MHSIAYNKGKDPIVPHDVDTPTDDELSSASSPSLNLSTTKNTRAKLHKRPSHRPAFSNTISGTSHRARREAGKGQNQPDRISENASVLPVGRAGNMGRARWAGPNWPDILEGRAVKLVA